MPESHNLDSLPIMRDYITNQRSMHIHAVSQLNHLLNDLPEAILLAPIDTAIISDVYTYPLPKEHVS
jgi:hypothetical protein